MISRSSSITSSQAIQKLQGRRAFLNRAVGLLVALSCFPGAVGQAAGDEPAIKQIRQQYDQIESQLSHCTQVKRSVEGQSAEGGELIAYSLKGSLVKIAADYYGETGKAREEYYFSGDRVVFVLRTEVHYTKPFSGVVAKRAEERFYFNNASLIRWLGPGDRVHAVGEAEATQRGSELLNQANLLKGLANGPRKD